jgi:hypothetical protein
MNIDTEMPPSSSSVVAALRDFGLRNAGTPVADRLDAGQRGAALGERAQHQQGQREPGEGVALRDELQVGAGRAHHVAEHQDPVRPQTMSVPMPSMKA